MIHYLGVGLLLGLSAGLSPGPLTTLVISETLMHDVRAGVKVALAPLITDFPIVVLSVFILSRLSGFNTVLGLISFVGGAVVLMMGVKGMKVKPGDAQSAARPSRSFSKGILVNFLSPHPYLFWLSVGAPKMTEAWRASGPVSPALFLAGFYLLLIGSKVGLAVLAGKFKSVLSGPLYLFTMRFLGGLLCLLALVLFKDGLVMLNIL